MPQNTCTPTPAGLSPPTERINNEIPTDCQTSSAVRARGVGRARAKGRRPLEEVGREVAVRADTSGMFPNDTPRTGVVKLDSSDTYEVVSAPRSMAQVGCGRGQVSGLGCGWALGGRVVVQRGECEVEVTSPEKCQSAPKSASTGVVLLLHYC